MMNVEGMGVVDGDGDQIGDNGDGDDTESGNSVNSQGVESVQLSIESQLMHPHQLSQENIPILSRPPIQCPNRPYRHVRCHHRHGRIKFESIIVSQAQNVETAYLDPAYITQPP